MSGGVRFILVEPREGGNLGAAARAMKNFGFTEMVIAGEPPPPGPVAEWWASGAEDVVAAARRAPDLESALAGTHVAVATTSSRARGVQRPLTPRELAALHAALAPDQTLALVFGREDRGLTSEELARCGSVAVIPTSDLHPTMNLAQSVAIFAYELARAAPRLPAAPELADAASLERLHQAARSLLRDAGFLDENNPDRIYDDLRAIAARARLDPREVTILLGILRQIRWHIEDH
ncbi:MAG TPA: RNA methyltransferase [Thermoanaerobaculia bacterium]|nr:RNA methyltransferase [Thermoanaerobaculia bacterium]